MFAAIMHQNDALSLEPEAHLAHEWALFQSVETGACRNLYYSWRTLLPVVVVGRSRPIADDVVKEACQEDGVRILRRFSGGGTVVLGPGCLNYAVVLSLVSCPALADVAGSFRIILGRIVAALDVPGLAIAGRTDLVLGGLKVSGNAQRRGRRALIQHGTLLYDFDPGLASRYLREPTRQPAYRAARSHSDFIGNFRLPVEAIQARLEKAWKPAHVEGPTNGLIVA
jgi:lipoate-protein ligase A